MGNFNSDIDPNPDLNPNFDEIDQAIYYLSEKNFQQAREILGSIVARDPNHLDALQLLGVVELDSGEYKLAEEYFNKALSFAPNEPTILINLGLTHVKQNNYTRAIELYEKALPLTVDRNVPFYLARVYQSMGDFQKAVEYYQQALRSEPSNPAIHNNIGNCYRQLSNINEALSHYYKGLSYEPNHLNILTNLAITLMQASGRNNEALQILKQALNIDPEHYTANLYYGHVMRLLQKSFEALNIYQSLLQKHLSKAELHYYIGLSYNQLGDYTNAKEYFENCYALDPDYAANIVELYQIKRQCCDWTGLDTITQKLDDVLTADLASGNVPVEEPLIYISRSNDESLALTIAEKWSQRIYGQCNKKFQHSHEKFTADKIKIGYISGDFHDHATSHLIQNLFGLHDRKKFEVIVFSYGPDDGSCFRKKIQNDSDQFFDCQSSSHLEIATLINQVNIQILVDLKGYTRFNRLEVVGFRPAPIQVSYLGYPGTTGSQFFDYILTDETICPKEAQQHYSEVFAYLPDCYQVTSSQKISQEPSRKSQNLPENSIVFCSFNQGYKIDPQLFSVWLDILKQVSDSVLWLYQQNDMIADNLKLIAEKNNVDSDRLIFAKHVNRDEHLQRLQCADIALDTLIYNGHTSTTDALLAHIPVITLTGKHFPSRVATSILKAAELTETITTSLQEYQDVAVKYATDNSKLTALKEKLLQTHQKPLFNTEQFTQHLENLYQKMWQVYTQKRVKTILGGSS